MMYKIDLKTLIKITKTLDELGVETESDKALANALAKGSEQTPDKPGMSTGAKVGIALGILAPFLDDIYYAHTGSEVINAIKLRAKARKLSQKIKDNFTKIK